MPRRADLYSQLQCDVGQAEDIWVNQILWLIDTLHAWVIFKESKYTESSLCKKHSNRCLIVDHFTSILGTYKALGI